MESKTSDFGEIAKRLADELGCEAQENREMPDAPYMREGNTVLDYVITKRIGHFRYSVGIVGIKDKSDSVSWVRVEIQGKDLDGLTADEIISMGQVHADGNVMISRDIGDYYEQHLGWRLNSSKLSFVGDFQDTNHLPSFGVYGMKPDYEFPPHQELFGSDDRSVQDFLQGVQDRHLPAINIESFEDVIRSTHDNFVRLIEDYEGRSSEEKLRKQETVRTWRAVLRDWSAPAVAMQDVQLTLANVPLDDLAYVAERLPEDVWPQTYRGRTALSQINPDALPDCENHIIKRDCGCSYVIGDSKPDAFPFDVDLENAIAERNETHYRFVQIGGCGDGLAKYLAAMSNLTEDEFVNLPVDERVALARTHIVDRSTVDGKPLSQEVRERYHIVPYVPTEPRCQFQDPLSLDEYMAMKEE